MNALFISSLFFYVVASLLVLEWVAFYLPQWNWAKRGLFHLCYPLLVFSDRFLIGKKVRGLLLALVLVSLGYGLGHASVQGLAA